MRRIIPLVAIAAVGAVGLVSCAPREAPVTTRRPSAPRPPVIVTPATSADYVATAGSIDLFVIRASEYVASRARDNRTRDLAALLAEGHRGLASQLSLAGRRLNLLPRTTLLSAHEEMLRELQASGDAADTYRRQMHQVHETALRLHGAYAARGDSPTLRPVAANAERVIRSHRGRM